MRNNKIILLVLCIMLPLLYACHSEDGVIMHQYQSMPDDGWDSQNKVTFTIDSIETTGIHRLTAAIRTTSDIYFQKIYLVVDQQLENPTAHFKDTVIISLTDKMGNIKGDGLNLYNFETNLPKPFKFYKGQRGTITLYHIMRRNQLFAVKDVGIKIKRQ